MYRAVSSLLCAVFALVLLCPALCVAQAKVEKHACCPHGKAAPSKTCSHAQKAPSAELPAVASIAPVLPVPSEWFRLPARLMAADDVTPPKSYRPALTPPPVLRI